MVLGCSAKLRSAATAASLRESQNHNAPVLLAVLLLVLGVGLPIGNATVAAATKHDHVYV